MINLLTPEDFIGGPGEPQFNSEDRLPASLIFSHISPDLWIAPICGTTGPEGYVHNACELSSFNLRDITALSERCYSKIFGLAGCITVIIGCCASGINLAYELKAHWILWASREFVTSCVHFAQFSSNCLHLVRLA